MKGLFIVNRYYRDEGMEYIYLRLKEEFAGYGVSLDRRVCPLSEINGTVNADCDFVVFWDKDVTACRLLENSGVRVYNNSYASLVLSNKNFEI